MKYRAQSIGKVILTLSMTVGASAALDAATPDRMRPEPDVSFLTEGAQSVFTQIKNLRMDIHSRVDAICGPNSALRNKVRGTMDADQRSRMKACFDSNEAAVSVWRDLGKTLRDACLPVKGGRGRGDGIGRGPGFEGRGPDGGGRLQGPRMELTEAQKQEFETKLLSNGCSQAIASVQEKLK